MNKVLTNPGMGGNARQRRALARYTASQNADLATAHSTISDLNRRLSIATRGWIATGIVGAIGLVIGWME